jgi:hypothetical protein
MGSALGLVLAAQASFAASRDRTGIPGGRSPADDRYSACGLDS